MRNVLFIDYYTSVLLHIPFITQTKGLHVRTVSRTQVCLVTRLCSAHELPTHLRDLPLQEYDCLACRAALYMMFNHYVH